MSKIDNVKATNFDNCFVDGDWVASQGAGSIRVIHPATAASILEVVAASEKDVDPVVSAARHAFDRGSLLCHAG
jgi:acyl-CoA reductase-like NAD-dependent aldehyde dehydrogenase